MGQVNVTHKGCGSGCGTFLAILLVVGLLINYWYVAVPLAVLLAGGMYWAYRTERLPYQQAPPTVAPDAAPALEMGLKVCPDCAETVQAAARKCRYCGYAFTAE